MAISNNNVPDFMATIVPGLEDIALKELQDRFPELEIKDTLRGKIFFKYDGSYKDLFVLKTVDNLYLYFGSFSAGPHKTDLVKISDGIRNINIQDKLSQIHPNIKSKRIIVSASRSGKHTYNRFDVANTALNALLNQYPFESGTVEQHDIAFRIDVDEDRAYMYCKLTPADFRFRGRDREFLSGALKASVAHAMVLVSGPDSTDVFIDPFCGSGTIPFERAFYDAYSIMASDLSKERLEAARKNLPDYVGINRWDARHMELPDESVTKIVSNIPWGKQIEVDDIGSLYSSFLKEAKRVLTPKGKIVLLTDEGDILRSAAKASKLRMTSICTISLHGLHPSIFLLGK